MSKWSERIEAHPAVSELTSLSAVLDGLVVDGSSVEVLEDLERVRNVYAYVSSLLAARDPLLISPSTLNNLLPFLQKISRELAAFEANKNGAHLVNANNQIDAMLPHLGQIAVSEPNGEIESTREAVVSFRRSAGQYLAAIEREKGLLAEQLESLGARVSEVADENSRQKARLDSAITEYQQQFSQAEAARREEFNQVLSELRSQTKAVLDTQSENLQSTLSESKERLNEQSESAKEMFSAQRSEIKELAAAELEQLRTYRDQAQELMQVIGSTGMAGEFQKAATSAKHSVWLWQAIAVGSMIGLISFAVLAYHSTLEGAVDWASMGTRLFVAVTFGALAAFAVRQGDRYHDVELRNRRYQLELSSIDPYLAALPAEMRDTVKIQLAERLFGGAGSMQSRVAAKNGEGTSLDLVRLALETLQEVLKKAS